MLTSSWAVLVWAPETEIPCIISNQTGLFQLVKTTSQSIVHSQDFSWVSHYVFSVLTSPSFLFLNLYMSTYNISIISLRISEKYSSPLKVSMELLAVAVMWELNFLLSFCQWGLNPLYHEQSQQGLGSIQTSRKTFGGLVQHF